MHTEVRLFATLRDGRGKKVLLETMEGVTTPRDIIGQLGIPVEDVAILLKNGRDANWDEALQQEDYLSVFPPVGGG